MVGDLNVVASGQRETTALKLIFATALSFPYFCSVGLNKGLSFGNRVKGNRSQEAFSNLRRTM